MLRGGECKHPKEYIYIYIYMELMTPPSLPISESISSNAVLAADF